MFRILIVDDVKEIVKQLKVSLTEALREAEGEHTAQINTASNVHDAQKLIENAHLEKRPYHAIILDLKLPRQEGDSPEFDESLCMLARRVTPYTLIAHITAYTDDELVTNHLKKYHLEQVDRSFALSKADREYGLALASELKAFLYGNLIEEQMAKVADWTGSQGFTSVRGHRANHTRVRGTGSMTHDLAALFRNITKYWHDLDDATKERIKKVFHVADQGDGIRISLINIGSEQ